MLSLSISDFSTLPPGKTQTLGANLEFFGLWPIKTYKSFFFCFVITRLAAGFGLTGLTIISFFSFFDFLLILQLTLDLHHLNSYLLV